MWKCECGNNCDESSNFCPVCGAGIDNKKWYYSINGARVGPVNIDKIRNEISIGNINAKTLVWSKGYVDWKRAEDTSLYRYISTEVPPMKVDEVSDKWAWALATIPLIINLFLFEIGLGQLGLTIVVIILNCMLLFSDIAYLKTTGINPGNWVFLGLILVPIYLFIRASKTTKKYGYAFTWCTLFIISILPIW